MTERARKAVVIGAGLGGLALALRLARRGWGVTVCEQHDRPGGKMNRWRMAGHTFDTGPSLITMPWVFDELWQAIGARLEDDIEWVRVHPHAEYRYPDGLRFDVSPRLPEFLPVVRELEGGDASGFFRFLGLGARLFELSRATFFRDHPRYARPNADTLKALRFLPLRHGFGNYHRVVEHHFRGPHLRQLFDRYATYVGSSPYRMPSTLAVIPYLEFAYGGWHVRGGLYRIVEALTAHADRLGVEVRTGCTVTRILRHGDRIRGVETSDGTTLHAGVVAMNGDAHRTAALLDPSVAGELPLARRSLSGLVFLFALRERLPDIRHHTVCFSADYPREFSELFDEHRFPADPTVYVNAPSRTDPGMAPPGRESLFVMANAPAAGAWDTAAVADARTRVLARLRASRFPELEGRIAEERVLTPRTFAEQYAMPGGALYGQASHGWRGAFMRPPNKDPRIRGLYYVGGSSHPGGGTPTVLLSAAITETCVERYERD